MMPNPVPPLLRQVTAALRKAVSEAHGRLRKERDRAVAELEAWEVWLKLESQDRVRVLETNELGPIPELDIGTDQALMDCLEETALQDWENQLLALKTRTGQAREEAARLLAPKAVSGPTTAGNPEQPGRRGSLHLQTERRAIGGSRRAPRNHSIEAGSRRCHHSILRYEVR